MTRSNLVRDSAKAFADAELRPRVTDAYLNETPAPELFPLMGSTGLFGMTLPERHGGSDASPRVLRLGRA